MVKELIWRRMLIAASALSIVVILLLFLVMYEVRTDTTGVATPEQGIPFLWAILICHLPVGSVFIWQVTGSRRGQHKNMGAIVTAGLVAIFFGLLFLNAGFTFFGTSMEGTGIVLMFCSGSDILAGILALIARIFIFF